MHKLRCNLSVDPSQDATNCEYCNVAFIVGKAINNYSIANAQISAQNVNINLGNVQDFVIEKGVLKEYKGNDKEITIPNVALAIGDNAFKDGISLMSVIIPESVTQIGKRAFENCINLKSVSILGNVKELDINLFVGSHNIQNITINDYFEKNFELTYENKISLFGNVDIKRILVPKDFTIKNKVEAKIVLLLFLRGVGYRGYSINEALNTVCIEEFVNKYVHYIESDNRPIYVNGENVLDKLKNTAREGCYIATAVYYSYDAPEVRKLRSFRDETLNKSMFGRLLIKIYYSLSPPMARRLIRMRRLNSAVRCFLDKIVEQISRN